MVRLSTANPLRPEEARLWWALLGDLLRGKNESQKTRPKVPINVWISLSLVEGNPQTHIRRFGVWCSLPRLGYYNSQNEQSFMT